MISIKTLAFLMALLLFSSSSVGESLLKRPDFDYVAVSHQVYDCFSDTEQRVSEIVEGELLRARLKDFVKLSRKGDKFEIPDELMHVNLGGDKMVVVVSCEELQNLPDNRVFTVQMFYEPGRFFYDELLLIPMATEIGFGDRRLLDRSVRSAVEGGITFYLKKNLE